MDNPKNRCKTDPRSFPGRVLEVKEEGTPPEYKGIMEFSEELSDGGERNEYIEHLEEEGDRTE